MSHLTTEDGGIHTDKYVYDNCFAFFMNIQSNENLFIYHITLLNTFMEKWKLIKIIQ